MLGSGSEGDDTSDSDDSSDDSDEGNIPKKSPPKPIEHDTSVTLSSGSPSRSAFLSSAY